jgi:hypothetical protein
MNTHPLISAIAAAALLAGLAPPVIAGTLDLEAESGAAWFSRNDVRIPGDTGTRFDLTELTGTGPDAYARLHGTYEFNSRHALRFTIAPLRASGTGTLDRDVRFDGSTFREGARTRATYRFDTYRLTYRWMFQRGDPWDLGVGVAVLVRDAEIELEQGSLRESDDDLGLVPLLHLYGEYRASERTSVVLDLEGAAAPQGRAIDAAVKFKHQWPSGWHAAIGYRTIEGGADNDNVYTFAWVHQALLSVGYEFQ